MKKMASLILALTMLLGLVVAVPVSADTVLVAGEILNQYAEETAPDFVNLSFGINANVSGMKIAAGTAYTADYTDATVEYNGQTAKVTEMGVMLTNSATFGAHPEQYLNVGAENGIDILRVAAEKMYNRPEATSCFYVARIRNIPYFARDFELTARPYFILEINGSEEVAYTEVDCESYLDIWGRNRELTLPEANYDLGEGVVLESVVPSYQLESVDKRDILMDTTFTVKNGADAYIAAGSYFEYACYDENGVAIKTEQINLNGIEANATATFTVDVPLDTCEIAIVSKKVQHFALPAIGSDIDVTKKKNRIRVSNTRAVLNEDGNYDVTLTFRNYSTNWITEETDYIQYTYYDAAGTKIKTETLYIGVIDTKKNKTKDFEITIPGNAVKVEITKSKIVYWTEWS